MHIYKVEDTDPPPGDDKTESSEEDILLLRPLDGSSSGSSSGDLIINISELKFNFVMLCVCWM